MTISGVLRRAIPVLVVTAVAAVTSVVPAVASVPTLVVAPGALTLVSSGAAEGTLSVSTSDGSPVSIAAAVDRSWLSATASTTSGSSATVSVVTSAVPPGRYTGSITLTAAGFDTIVVPVQLTSTGALSTNVNFQSETAPTPAGYLRDFGEPFGPRTGTGQGPGGLEYGWVDVSTGAPLSLVGNGRDRNRTGIDQRFDTVLHMQGNDVPRFNGVRVPGTWELSVPDGSYDVLVAVGDAPSGTVYDSQHSVTVEGVAAVTRFQATPSQEYKQASVTVAVTDGRLTLAPTGGTNTKIAFVQVTTHVDQTSDTKPPAAPTNVRASGGDTEVSITWNAGIEPDLAGYNVYRATTSVVPVTGAPLNGTTLLTAPSYLDRSVTNGTNYFYVVQAVDASGNKATSTTVNAVPQPPLTTTVKVNFQDPSTTPPLGYLRDSGEAYGPRGGAGQGTGLSFGWVVQGGSTPLDLSANGRNRNRAPTNAGLADVRLATFLQMQAKTSTSGTTTPGSWQIALPNGAYLVTVSVGDASYADSVHAINVEGQSLISGFRPTTATPFQSASRTVNLADGLLTIDALGGTNTKIDYVDIQPDTTATARPSVRGSTPLDGATNVRRDAGVSAEVVLPNVGNGVDPATLTSASVRLVRVSDGQVLPAEVNTSGGGDVIVLQPSVLLDPTTQYRFVITSSVKDLSGAAFVPYSATFTTGTVGGTTSTGVAFTQVPLGVTAGKPYTSVAKGPDGRLYATTLSGEILRFPINADGTLGAPTTITSVQAANGGACTILGLAFDPSSTATNVVVWVSVNAYAFNNAPDWSGKITRLSGTDLSVVQDYVVGLPRSVRDHMTNSPVFGPDGALYVAQGAQSSGGDADAAWGNRPEHLLSAAVLRIDTRRITSPPLNVQTEAGGTYDPFAAGAPLTLYATGVRNAYDLVWSTTGHLYAPTNGSATGGNTPASSDPLPASCAARIDSATQGPYTGPQVPAVRDMPVAEHDWVHEIDQGGYYGHPDAARCEFVFNGGNPTAGADPAEETQYPVGTMPDRNWRGATSFDVGAHYSPNGAVEYTSDVFGPSLKGKLLVVRYSEGKDVVAFDTTGPGGAVVGMETGIPGLTGFDDPVDVALDASNGNLYVAELGGYDLVLLRPGAASGATGTASTSTSRVVLSSVTGTVSGTQDVGVRNDGDGNLTVSALSLAGADAGQFLLTGTPTLPITLAPGASLTVQVALAPTSAGVKSASLAVVSNDPQHPTTSVVLRGLAAAGLGGSNEPSLQRIFDTFQIKASTGDPDPSTNGMPTTSPLGDEVLRPMFRKAGTGPVVVTPLAAYAPSTSPAVAYGWYVGGASSSPNALFTVASSAAQTVQPAVTGTTSFDPGADVPFGLYSSWPAFAGRTTYQDDALNTWATDPHQVRVYPMTSADGTAVPDTYVVALEDGSGNDWNDIPVVVSNVAPLPGKPRATVSNLDGVPFADRLVFSRIGTSLVNTYSVHDMASARVTNTGTSPLTVYDATVSGAWELTNPGVLPAVLPPGGTVDLTVRFVAVGGGLQEGALTITTNDPVTPVATVTLAGYWQSVSEGGVEPSLPTLVRLFGYSTVILNAGQNLNQQGRVATVGDEVLSPFWVRASTSKPVTVRQLASYRTQNASTIMKWLPKTATTATNLFTNVANAAQSVLPPLLGTTSTPAAGSFTPSGVFGLKVDGEFSDDTRNSSVQDVKNGCVGACGHHVRFFPAKDASGAVILDTWIMAMDYNGINYDYQDNVYLVSNLKPAP